MINLLFFDLITWMKQGIPSTLQSPWNRMSHDRCFNLEVHKYFGLYNGRCCSVKDKPVRELLNNLWKSSHKSVQIKYKKIKAHTNLGICCFTRILEEKNKYKTCWTTIPRSSENLQIAFKTLAINSLMFLLSFLERATKADATPHWANVWNIKKWLHMCFW